jgi:prepilin signal peptidase PulO-like enzyme (type II secretory pathway)
MMVAILNTAPIPLLGLIFLIVMFGAAYIGRRLYERGPKPKDEKDGGESYSVSAILGLLALLTGFTFSLAINRFETRRELVLEHANAVGTAYLRVQLLPQPHRARLSSLIVEYADNAVALASAPPDETAPLLAKDDDILTRLWAATAAGYDSVQDRPFSGVMVSAINSLIDNDGARRAARVARIPTEVFVVLLIYLFGAATVLGYMLKSRPGRIAGIFLIVSFTLSLLLILDIDRPTAGTIRESQRPMEDLRASLKSQPPAVFDRWRSP